MTKISSFQGLKVTKENGDKFILEKSVYLMYLAHTQRLFDQTGKLEPLEFDSIINSIQKSKRIAPKEEQMLIEHYKMSQPFLDKNTS
jgi:uracil-DNA glycosylase